MIKDVNISIGENTPFFSAPPSTKKVHTSHFPNIKLLMPAQPTLTEKTWAALALSTQILFAPLTLFVYAISKSFSLVAASQGLGTDEEVKPVNQVKRQQLLEIGGEDIKFGIKGGAILEGMFFETSTPAPHPKTILICTGSHQSYENYAIPMVKELKSMGHNVMVFNYEGFGDSGGTKSEDGVYRSVEAAYQYLKQEKQCPDASIVAWGYSLGSGAVSDLASKHTVDIIIDRGFSSMSQVAYQRAPSGLKTVAKIIFIVGAHFNNLTRLTQAKGRVLIAQGKWDKDLDTQHHGHILRDALSKNDKVFYKEVNSAHFHTDSYIWFSKGSPDRQIVEQFLDPAALAMQ